MVLVRKYLTFLPSAALSESIWSLAKFIWNPLRNSLDQEYVRAVTVLAMNWQCARLPENSNHLIWEEFVDWLTDSVEKRIHVRDGKPYYPNGAPEPTSIQHFVPQSSSTSTELSQEKISKMILVDRYSKDIC
mmetsp:Transcript_14101/g.21221  ORF Transcript_14101/g.21221 Transcript_14101/m.21221 type:complete len:132 (-) Transcript_14101:68-463(-)